MGYSADNPLDRLVAGASRSGDLRPIGFEPLDYRGPAFTWEQGVRVLRNNWTLALKIACVGIAMVATAVFAMRDVYEPVARLEIAPPMSGIRTLPEIESVPEIENQDYLETQTQLLKSDALAVSVIRDLQLDRNAEFGGAQGVASKTSKGDAGTLSKNDRILLGEQVDLATISVPEFHALELFRDNLSVSPIRNTRLVEVSFSSHNPETARDVTNAVVAKFIESGYRHRYNDATQVSNWLSTQLTDLHEKVLDSNAAVSSYQSKYGIIETDEHDVPTTQLLGEVNHQLSEAEATRIENEAYLKMVGWGQIEYVPAVRDDKVYQDLLSRQADTRMQLVQARAVYGDENVNVKKLDQEVTENGKELEEERTRIAGRIRAVYSSAKEQEESLGRQREQLRTQIVAANSKIVGYRMLKNEAMANAELYNTLQARLKEAGIYAGLHSDNVRVVDLAENFQKPTGPHRIAYLALGSLISVVLGIAACFVKDSFDNTVRTPEDVKAWAGLKSLALVPLIEPREKRRNRRVLSVQAAGTLGADTSEPSIALMKPLTPEAEAVRELRTALTELGRGKHEVILISSSMEGEGKTTLAANFALALARIGRTCLVDADLRRPMAAAVFGVSGGPGLSDVLCGSTALNNALVEIADAPGLVVLPSGSSTESPSDLLASAKMQEMCGLLRTHFEFVVIDSPPVIPFSDARYMSRLADEVVLVGRYGVTTRRAIQRSAELLQDIHAPLAGVVLNGIDYSSPDYHYFTYGYSRAASKGNTPTPPEDNSAPKTKAATA